MSSSKAELTAKIADAQKSIDEAERDLDLLLTDISTAPRAEKTTITPVLEAAFHKLRRARVNLGELQQMVLAALPEEPPSK